MVGAIAGSQLQLGRNQDKKENRNFKVQISFQIYFLTSTVWGGLFCYFKQKIVQNNQNEVTKIILNYFDTI